MEKEIINANDIKSFLNEKLAGLKIEQDYNILVHQLMPHHSSYMYQDEIRSILQNGLRVSQYATIFGTLALLGEIDGKTTDKILNYRFYPEKAKKAVLIVAMPKYVAINGENLEISSYNGLSAKDKFSVLLEEYKKTGIVPENRHFKSCMFDAIKEYSELPVCYNLGILIRDDENNQYFFYDSQTHLSESSDDDKKQHEILIDYKVNNHRRINRLIVILQQWK